MQTYETIPNVENLSDKDKRDIFLQAVLEAFPEANIADYWARQGGKGMLYLNLKDFILKVQAATTKIELPISSLYV